MTKTVCDICGCDNPEYHCVVPMYKRYNMMKSGVKLGEYKTIELTEVDFCTNHYIMIADFIETMKEDSNVI